MVLCELLSLSEPQLPHLYNGDNYVQLSKFPRDKVAYPSVSAWQMKLFHRWLFWLVFLSILGPSFRICKMKIITPCSLTGLRGLVSVLLPTDIGP